VPVPALLRSLYREHSSLNNFAVRDEQASPVPAHLRSLYREHSSLNNFAVRDEQASPVPAHLRSLYHEPALTRFTACYAGCSFSNGTRKTNAAFGVACFSFVLIISHLTFQVKQ